MNCPQCSQALIEPNGHEKYCEDCGFPDGNSHVFTMPEIKAYMRDMFLKQSCAEGVRIENQRLAVAYNLLGDDHNGIARFCDKGIAEGLTMQSFEHVNF